MEPKTAADVMLEAMDAALPILREIEPGEPENFLTATTLMHELEKRGWVLAEVIPSHYDELPEAEAAAGTALDATLYHEAMLGPKGVTVHTFCGCEEFVTRYNQLARLAGVDSDRQPVADASEDGA